MQADPDFEFQKNEIAIALRPIIELLEHRQTVLDGIEWSQFARKTWASVMSNPRQYIPQGQISDDVTHQAIYEIFNEFLEQHRHFRDLS